MTLNAFFVVRWTDTRLVIDQDRIDEILGPEAERADEPEWIPVRLNFTDIYNEKRHSRDEWCENFKIF